jgi:hypothetical protein
MTNIICKRADPPPILADDEHTMTMERIVEIREELVREGLVVDTGRRKFCEQTGRFEIVWGLSEKGEPRDARCCK